MLENNSTTFKSCRELKNNNNVTVTLTFVMLYEKDGPSKQSKTGCQEGLSFAQQKLNTFQYNYLATK